MKKPIKAILALFLALASGVCVGDWTDAGWYVSTCGTGCNVVKIVNTNKLSFRVYAFNRLTGALKSICWNTSKAEEFYVNGESDIELTMNGEKAKLEFVSMTEKEDKSPTHDRMLTLSAPLCEPSTMDDGSLRYAFNFSIPLY